jgi:hypothetical protein
VFSLHLGESETESTVPKAENSGSNRDRIETVDPTFLISLRLSFD